MIDLKLLEVEIDNFLENQTTDSMLNWLYEKRISDMKKRLGNGSFDTLSCNNRTTNRKLRPGLVPNNEQAFINNEVRDENSPFCYDLAA
jgi:hypothetical protein